MERLTLTLPAMYGDHHVTEVRRILGALPGVAKVYASAARQRVDVEYDAGQIDPPAIEGALRARGYATRGDGQGAVLGVCPGLEMRTAGEVHPADRNN